MTMFLEGDNETTWNDSYTYHGHVSWGEHRNYLKWKLYLLWPCFLSRTAKLHETTDLSIMPYFLTRTAKLPEMTAIPIMVIFLQDDSLKTWNDSYTHYGHISWGKQRNCLKWQLYLLWPYFLRRTAKLHKITDLPIMATFLHKDNETIWNDSYTYYRHISRGG